MVITRNDIRSGRLLIKPGYPLRTKGCNMKCFARAAVTITVAGLAACGSNSQSLQPARAPSQISESAHSARFPHGAEIESGTILAVSYGNYGRAFEPGWKLKRTASAIEVTFGGKTYTFPPDARISYGTHHRYAKAPTR